ncbi:hypothetical protein C7M84_019001 [Penaeus vannamei]|uniref:RNA-directed DNA polymerase from mobile element jockey-like n=1 Tax=Penaeus vannamei TaxID=6689 RepID=A0A3R7PEG7_PENVA|nr:hypothetical protein C7M84_019001 [Penaeus vannamei]
MWTNLRLASGAKRSMPSLGSQQTCTLLCHALFIHPTACIRFKEATTAEAHPTTRPSSMGTLLRLFNASYHQGTLPQAWKSANLIPIPKRDSTNAFRPISLLSCIGRNRYVNAQLALNLLESTCKELGLKINSNKTKALQLRRHINLQNLYIGNLPLDWVNSHKCLGIFFNENLSSTTQLRRLLLRTKPLLNVMRRLTSSLGQVFRTLRLFYTHAVRSLIDYSAPALLTLSPQDFVTLETIQNRAMRVILAAPRWTRLANLRMESFLPSLKCRMHQLTAGLVAKILSRSRPSPLKHITANLLYPNELDGTTFVWHASLIKTLQSLNAIPMIISRGMDAPNSHYVPKPPWAPQTIKFHTDTFPTSKALCTKEILNNVRHLIDSLHQPQNLIFTDGSIDQSSSKAGAAMVTDLPGSSSDRGYAFGYRHY